MKQLQWFRTAGDGGSRKSDQGELWPGKETPEAGNPVGRWEMVLLMDYTEGRS